MLIAIDHGNKQMKTVHGKPFVSGLEESSTKPFGKDILKYQGSFYTLSEQRIPYHKDKSEDDRFFILSLFAIAAELEAKGCESAGVTEIQLAIGVPPAYFGSQGKALTEYFKNRGIIRFEYYGNSYAIYIEHVLCFPQAYAAAVTMLPTLMECPKALILDIGGHTADYMVMKNGKTSFNSLAFCDSLENGVDVLYNRIRSSLNAELDLLLEESEIDAILQGKPAGYGTDVVAIVERQAQGFINDLFSTLRERQVDVRTSKVIFVGGGSILLKKQIENSGKVARASFVEDINANAKGYEFLYRLETMNG